MTITHSPKRPVQATEKQPLEDVTAVILAGGMARRMNGQDKGLIEYHGTPMVNGISNALENQCKNIMINANRNIERYKALGFDVFSDELKDYQGPLSGMYTALEKLKTNWLVTVPCDGPFIDAHYVHRMCQAVAQDRRQLAVASFDNRLQPVYALIHKDLRPSLGAFLETGERKIDRWYRQHSFSVVHFNDSQKMFININTPEQLTDVETKYSKE